MTSSDIAIQNSLLLRYDELHPSQQSDRIVAREITAVMKGEYNQWTTWLS
jgi:hypothetical protein